MDKRSERLRNVLQKRPKERERERERGEVVQTTDGVTKLKKLTEHLPRKYETRATGWRRTDTFI